MEKYNFPKFMNLKLLDHNCRALAGICFGLNYFRKENMHCDIELKVEEKTYPCHKIVIAASSKHFETMFSSSFREKEACSITLLGDIDSTVFEEVLEFLYIATIKFTEENAYGVLRTSHYLQIEELENRCCDYISRNPNVEQLLEISEYLCKIGRNDYVEIAIKHVVSKMRLLRKNEVFCDLSHVCVSAILKNGKLRNYPECSRQEFIEATFEWVKYKWEDRKCYLKDLMNCVIPSSDCSLYFLEEFSELLSIDNKTFISPNIDIFCSTSHGIDEMYYNEGSWIWRKKICEMRECIKIIRFQNYDYYLSWSGTVNNFWTDGSDSVINLTLPSIYTSKFEILTNGETLFLYNCYSRSNSHTAMLQYNFDINQWFDVSTVPQRLYHSYFTSIDKMLYLIGGTTNTSVLEAKSNVMQCYDKRCKNWIIKLMDESFSLNGSVCVYQNEIYIYDEPTLKQGCLYIYNSVAGKFRLVDNTYPFDTPGIMFSSDLEICYLENKIRGMIYNVLRDKWVGRCTTPSAIETTSGLISINRIEHAMFC